MAYQPGFLLTLFPKLVENVIRVFLVLLGIVFSFAQNNKKDIQAILYKSDSRSESK